jgi:predicted NAD/FAD-binding protein
MKVAVIGTGISGLVTAYLLSEDHEITVFEANRYVGGHTRTVRVEKEEGRYAVDTGFIVFNEPNYPNFSKLLKRLGVDSQPSNMSFSVQCQNTGLEYRGTSLNSIFAQRRNLLRPSFHRMLLDIGRFSRNAKAILGNGHHRTTLAEYVRTHGYSEEFLHRFLIPMGAAIWSASAERLMDFPIRYLVQFFDHHRFLSLNGMPEWRTITGGSQRYVDEIIRPFQNRIRLNCPVRLVRRFPDRVEVGFADGQRDTFDRIVIATHSDQALAMLADPSPAEREILGAMPYQENDVVLHTDTRLLPRTKRARASWNYHVLEEPQAGAAVTYYMNMLQNIPGPHHFNVTLNRTNAVASERILDQTRFHHPVYALQSVDAQKREAEINGVNRTYYCGAYWGYGFHEDGVKSALRVCRHFGKSLAS